jgi:hypothetical protein
MSIQRTAFPLILDANDFQRIDRGMKWGIKCHEIPAFGQAVYVVYTGIDGSQKQEALDDAFDIHVFSDHGGDVRRWLKERLIPKLNAWLAKVFPPKAADDDGFTPVIGAGPLEEAHALIGKIVITVASDGTLKASAP